MLHFEGDKDFLQAPQELWSKLSDASFLVQCIPGVQKVTEAAKDRAMWVLRPGFAFARGTLDMTLRITETSPEESVRVTVVSKGIGSSSTVEASLSLKPGNSGTRVHWTADVTELGGLLKAIPQGLITAAAQKVIGDVWGAIEERMKDEG
jgi:carbon monoxide dehydrogenase subunit G